jgi:hypothetical protein
VLDTDTIIQNFASKCEMRFFSRIHLRTYPLKETYYPGCADKSFLCLNADCFILYTFICKNRSRTYMVDIINLVNTYGMALSQVASNMNVNSVDN